MDFFVLSVLVLVFAVLPLYLRSNIVTVLGALAIGWVVNDIAGAELVRQGSILLPGASDLARFLLYLGSFGLSLLAIILTRKKVKAPPKIILQLGILPAVVIVAWKLLLGVLPLDQARDLSSSAVNVEIVHNQEYALWLALFMITLLMLMGRKKKTKDDKGKKK